MIIKQSGTGKCSDECKKTSFFSGLGLTTIRNSRYFRILFESMPVRRVKNRLIRFFKSKKYLTSIDKITANKYILTLSSVKPRNAL